MSVAFDAESESHTGTTGSASEASFNWSHNPVGVPRGVLVFVFINADADDVTSVTYGGAALTELGSFGQDTADEPGRTYAFFLGVGVPTNDPATVVVNRVNNADVMYAVCFTQTALIDTQAVGLLAESNNQALAEENINDGSLSGTNSVRFAGTIYGGSAIPTVGANSTQGPSIDYGTRTASTVRETTAGQGARPIGWAAASEDVAALYVAIREFVNALGPTNRAEVGYEQDLTNWFPGEAIVYVGQDGSGAYRSAARFVMGGSGLAGSTIISATLTPDISALTGTTTGTIRAEKVTDAAAITARAPNTWGALTTASVALPGSPGTGTEPINVTPIIQELVDDVDYDGGAVAMLLDETVAATNFWEVNGTPMTLEIVYEPAGGGGAVSLPPLRIHNRIAHLLRR